MNLADIKFQINVKLKELQNLLGNKKIEVHPEGNSNVSFTFHGFKSPDEYHIALVDQYYAELEDLINLSYLNDLDKDRRSLLVEYIIESINFDEATSGKSYIDNVAKLDENQVKLLEEFESIQWSMPKQITEILNIKFKFYFDASKSKLAQIIWKGEVKQLAELFVELENKKWINPGNNKSSYYRTLSTMFTLPDSGINNETISKYLTNGETTFGNFDKILKNGHA